jgi:hypothetical protein
MYTCHIFQLINVQILVKFDVRNSNKNMLTKYELGSLDHLGLTFEILKKLLYLSH